MAQINRVHEELSAWQKMEESNANLFSAEVMNSPDFVKLKLKKIDELIARLSFSALPEEKDSLKLLAIERKLLVKKAYPEKKLWGRLFYFLTHQIRVIIHRRLAERQHNRQLQKIVVDMQRAGFAEYADQALTRIRQGGRDFSISATVLPSKHEQVHFNLKFPYTSLGHSFEGYRAIYRNDFQPDAPRSHNFGPDVPVKHAIKLIAGKAVLESYSENGMSGKRWIRLDSTRDVHGNLVAKHLPADALDLRKKCEILPFWKRLSHADQFRILGGVTNGDRVPVQVESKGKPLRLHVEFNLDQNILHVLDDKEKVMDLKKLWPGESTTRVRKELSKPKVRLNGITNPAAKAIKSGTDDVKQAPSQKQVLKVPKKVKPKIHVRR